MDTHIRLRNAANPSQPGPLVDQDNPMPVESRATGTTTDAPAADGAQTTPVTLVSGLKSLVNSMAALVQSITRRSEYPVDQTLLLTKAGIQSMATSTLKPGSFMAFVVADNGESYLALSSSPLATGDDVVALSPSIVGDTRSAWVDASVSQRVRHDLPVIELVGGSTDLTTHQTAINVVSAYQCSNADGAAYNATAGTYLTATLEQPLPADRDCGDLVHFDGFTDNRFSVPNCPIRFISPDRKTVCVGISDNAALGSYAMTVTPTLGTVKLYCYDDSYGNQYGAGFRFDGATATSGALYLKSNNNTYLSGTLSGDQRTTIATTAPVYSYALNGHFEHRPSSRYGFELGHEQAKLFDQGADTSTTKAGRLTRTSIGLPPTVSLSPRFRNHMPASATRPVAKIVQADHQAANNATTVFKLDVTPSSVGLAVGKYVTARGVRDQTNFANSATPAAISAVNDGNKTITVTWGTATGAIATSYGGSIILLNGGVDQPGIIGQVVQTVTYDKTQDLLTVTGNANWSGVGNVGEWLELHGLRNAADGSDMGLDGTWEVYSYNSSGATTMTLKPVWDISGARVTPAPAANIVAVNCGGSVIMRTTIRVHRIVLSQRQDQHVRIHGQGTSDIDNALPVVHASSVSATQGTAASLGTNGGGAWPVRGGAVRTADIGSAASAAGTTTSTSIDVTANCGGQQFNVDVTAVSGTSPRLYTRIRESFDGGSNFVTTFDLPPAVGTADKTITTPPLPVLGTHVAYVRTVTGTATPTVTNSVTRTSRPMENPPNRRQLVDRVVSLNTSTASTDYLYIEGTRKGQLVCSALPGATTAPSVKVQVCDNIADGAWVDVTGATLTMSAANPTASAIFDLPPSKFARLVPTAGAGVVADTYALMLKTWE